MSNHNLKSSVLLLLAYFFFLLFFLSFNAITHFSIHLPLFSNTPHHDSLLYSNIHHNHRIIQRIVKSSSHNNHSSTFHATVQGFFNNGNCNVRFFMIWIFPWLRFGGRELLSIESLFKSHPEACLVIVSESVDSYKRTQILRPFLKKGFRVMTVAPDFNYLFKDTPAESWFNQLMAGNVDAGKVYLGQNLSNLVRLALLYKFGGIYIDTDVIVLKSFSMLRNTIGEEGFHNKTRRLRTLNNAVLVFDEGHPLIWEFIKEFAVTFDGNKWGNNGPKLVSRVVSRVRRDGRFNFTIVPPYAFYPVHWLEIKDFLQVPRDEIHSAWMSQILENIRNQSLALHLWNTVSWELEVKKGSIVDIILSGSCIFCNSWNSRSSFES